MPGALEIAAQVDAELDRLKAAGLKVEVMACDPDYADTEVFCRHYGVPLECSANTIVVKAKTGGVRYAACVVLASTRLDVNRVVRKRLGARRVSFASDEETRAQTGMELGGVTPLALPAGMELWIDPRVMQCDYVVLGGGTRSTKIKADPEIFRELANVSVVEGLALEVPPKASSDAAQVD